MKKIIILITIITVFLTLHGCVIDKLSSDDKKGNKQINTNKTDSNLPTSKPSNDTNEPHLFSQVKDVTDDNNSAQQIKRFTDEELARFKLVKRYYPDFEYSKTYITTSEDDKKMLFNRKDNSFLNCLNSYTVIYHNEGFIDYTYDGGTGDRGYGTYYLFGDKTVLKTEITGGETSILYSFYKNGKSIDEGTTPNIKIPSEHQ